MLQLQIKVEKTYQKSYGLFAFASVQHLMTDVPPGMILRYAHANGLSPLIPVQHSGDVHAHSWLIWLVPNPNMWNFEFVCFIEDEIWTLAGIKHCWTTLYFYQCVPVKRAFQASDMHYHKDASIAVLHLWNTPRLPPRNNHVVSVNVELTTTMCILHRTERSWIYILSMIKSGKRGAGFNIVL